jgi:hypothetical protein
LRVASRHSSREESIFMFTPGKRGGVCAGQRSAAYRIRGPVNDCRRSIRTIRHAFG